MSPADSARTLRAVSLLLSALTLTVPNTPRKSPNVGAIEGGVVGGLDGSALPALLGFLYWRKRHPQTGRVDLIMQPCTSDSKHPHTLFLR